MNEPSFVFSGNNIKDICCICFRTKHLRPLYIREGNWYQTIIYPTTPHLLAHEMSVCIYCSHLIKKYVRFSVQCRNSHELLNQIISQGINPNGRILPQKLIHNLTEVTQTHSLGTEDGETKDLDSELPETVLEDTNLDADNAVYEEDNMPLVLLSENLEVVDEKKKEDEESTEKVQKGKGKKKKKLREGFSSRMTQETQEYIVIKLTKEQVLSEMAERATSEKYQRSLYKCSLCVKGFNFQDVLASHMACHDKSRGEFKCDLCSQYCPSAVSLRGHVKSHTTRYKCKVCGCVRLSRQHLVEHHANAHAAAPRTYTCHCCDFTTDKRTVIQRHVRCHRSEARRRCERCGRLFDNIASLRVHMSRHDKSQSPLCAVCGRRFVYPSLLARHVAAVHERADYYCVECDIRFKSADNMRLHFKRARRHREASAYRHECERCGERFMQSSSLWVHLAARHGLPKKHGCALCGRLYASKESLASHTRRVHAANVTHPAHACHVCDKVFTRKSILTVHLRNHSGERPFVCQCGASFMQRGTLTAHVNAKHKGNETLTPST